MHRVTDTLKKTCQQAPDRIATLYGSRRRTWDQILHRVRRLAGGLRAQGVGAGDRVAIWTLNSDRYIDYLYAVPWAGGVVVPLNTRLAPPEIRMIIDDSDAGVLLVDEMSYPLLEATLGGGTTSLELIYAGEGPSPPGTIGFEQLIEAQPIDDAERGGEDLYGIFYTGGTTGRSKGVMLSHRNVLANLDNVALVFDMFALPDDVEPVYLHVAPMFHLADLGSTFHVTARLGTHAIVPRFDPGETLRAIAEFRVTHTVLVPTMINMVLQLPSIDQYDLTSLRYVTYGASPMPPQVMARALEVFPRVRFMQGYGMTELSPLATILGPEYHLLAGQVSPKLGSAGRPVGTAEVRVVDQEDRVVPPGTIGEIVVRGPIVMQGYWKQPELTARTIRDGWMHTGDAGYFDSEGFLYIVDRIKDMVITGGENVYSIEVESALYAHPAVGMCAVFGIPDDEWGEAVHAVVVLKPEQAVTERELIDFARSRIAGYKCPKGITFRTDPMPISGAGKILKTELRAPYWQGRTRRVN
jgi:long-chain acyl-CoA synthetase